MITWTSSTPAINPQRWRSREEILKAHLESLAPSELAHVRPSHYALSFGWDFARRKYAQGIKKPASSLTNHVGPQEAGSIAVVGRAASELLHLQ